LVTSFKEIPSCKKPFSAKIISTFSEKATCSTWEKVRGGRGGSGFIKRLARSELVSPRAIKWIESAELHRGSISGKTLLCNPSAPLF